MRQLVLVALTLLILQACGNPINRKTAQNYTEAGYKALNVGEWKNARMYFSRAILNAQLGKVDPRTMAVLKYEYGRSSGVLCEWSEAESSLNEAYTLDQNIGGPGYMSLYELGRLNFDRRQYSKAKEYFDRVFVEFQRINAETRDPLGYAEFLDEYAATLQSAGGDADASLHRARALEIRKAFPAGKSHTEKTPYGTQCGAS